MWCVLETFRNITQKAFIKIGRQIFYLIPAISHFETTRGASLFLTNREFPNSIHPPDSSR